MINRRSVLLGLAGTCLVSLLAPYNDLAVNNTYLIGNYMPLAVLVFFATIILLINAPLLRRRSRHALTAADLSVAVAMMLVACAVPASGLMRYLPTSLVNIWHHADTNSDLRSYLNGLHLPNWMFPAFTAPDVTARAADAVVTDFRGRVPIDQTSIAARFAVVPWRAWLGALATWGIFLGALYGSILCLAAIVRRQWVENERLSFPLATVYLALIAPPARGNGFNALFRSRGFWIAFAAVFLAHATGALAQYFPRHVPEIPLRFSLATLLTHDPWRYMSAEVSTQTIYFAVIGIMFFTPAQVSFSLWFFYLALQAARMIVGPRGVEISDAMLSDQLVGGAMAFALMLIFVGRRHWMMVLRQMLRRRCAEDHPDDPEHLGRIARVFLICLLVMITWLILAGMTLAGAVVLVLVMLTVYMLVARIVAETGLLFAQLDVSPLRPWVYAMNDLPVSLHSTPRTYFWTAFFRGTFTRDVRETLSVYATHAQRIVDQASGEDASSHRRLRGLLPVLALALAVAYVTSSISMLYVEYSFATTLDRSQVSPLNSPWAADTVPRTLILDSARQMSPPGNGPIEIHNRLGHFGFGIVLVGVLSVLRLRFMSFPFHPVGFLMAPSYVICEIWFSVMIGWLIKLLLLRFGGASAYRGAREVFIGLVFGEAGAAAFWLIISLLLHAMGIVYHPIRLFPA
jgi:hypothetical protein